LYTSTRFAKTYKLSSINPPLHLNVVNNQENRSVKVWMFWQDECLCTNICICGQETFLRLPILQQKYTEFEMKNMCKSEEEAKKENLL